MATFFDFAPSSLAPFQFQPVLDGQAYTVIVTWNLFGQRYYVNLYQLDGTLVFCLPLIGSEDGVNIDALSWDGGVVTATTEAPHGYPVGGTVNLTISGAAPDAYNGEVSAFITGASAFSYALAAFPGLATTMGKVDYNISLTAGYFTSTLVFRQANQQFEVSP